MQFFPDDDVNGDEATGVPQDIQNLAPCRRGSLQVAQAVVVDGEP
jgi:hypothetical protein